MTAHQLLGTWCVMLLGVMVEGARILGVFPVSARSHHLIHQSVLMTLADAGHEMVVYSLYPPKQEHANYTHVQLYRETFLKNLDNYTYGYMTTPIWQCSDPFSSSWDSLFDSVFDNKKLMELVRSKSKFDLVITEGFDYQEFTLLLGHMFDAPTIAIRTWPTCVLLNNLMGNELSLAFYPNEGLPYSNKMSFVERTHSALCAMRRFYEYYWMFTPHIEKRLKTYFPEAPSLAELTKNVSLVFVNNHMLVDYAHPRIPNMIPIAGIHIGQGGNLSQDVRDIMDGATEGVILFSLGGVVPDNYIHEAFFEVCIQAFSNIPHTILWKTRNKSLFSRALSKNVKIFQWLSQEDVLAHPNCVLFVTHGGLQSQHEAIHYGVPVVGIPQFGDQHRNVAFYVAQGVGVRLLLEELSEETLTVAITTVIQDSRYKENMRRLSQVFRDRPMSPAESVVYWTEYVLHHGGAPHLTPSSVDLTWYQLCLLDVAAVVLAVFFCTSVVVYCIVRKCIRTVNSKSDLDRCLRIKKIE